MLPPSGLRGIVFDGQDMYAIEPAAEAAAVTVQPLDMTEGDTVVYRLSDALMPAETMRCEVVQPGTPPESASTAADAIEQLTAELQSMQTAEATITKQVRVGIVGDYEFVQQFTTSTPEDAIVARMNIVASGSPQTLEQILKQLNKLIDVLHAKDHTGETVVEKELALIKVRCAPEKRSEVLQIAEHFKAQTVDLSEGTLMLQVTGGTDKLDAAEMMLDKYGIAEMVRTGKVIMARGESGT